MCLHQRLESSVHVPPGRVRMRQQRAHFIVRHLVEVEVVHADGIERVRRGEAYDLVGFAGEGVERLAWCNRDGEDEPRRLLVAESFQDGAYRSAGGDAI